VNFSRYRAKDSFGAPMNSGMSKPKEKNLPVPVRRVPRTRESLANSRKQPESSSTTCSFSALTLPRSSRTSAMPPWMFTRTNVMEASLRQPLYQRGSDGHSNENKGRGGGRGEGEGPGGKAQGLENGLGGGGAEDDGDDAPGASAAPRPSSPSRSSTHPR
jgi:hypothetical protein